MKKQLTTKYGVPIPCDPSGRPMCDAPGRYCRFAAAMGAPTEHLPPESRLTDTQIAARLDSIDSLET